MLCISLVFAGCEFSCSKESAQAKGVWWWHKNLGEEYLDFAEDNGINEIYYCDYSFNNDTESFISKANAKDMKVYFLAGDSAWLHDDTELQGLIVEYIAFQEVSKFKFAGIHLDIEPHQDDSWDEQRESLILKLIDLVYRLNNTYQDISFDYDIPMWLNDEITYRDVSKPAYQHIIDYADRVVVMSYRDTVEDIYEMFKDEYQYGIETSVPVLVSVETSSQEIEKVTFKEEGRDELNNALSTLSSQVSETLSGYAVHHIKSWYEL